MNSWNNQTNEFKVTAEKISADAAVNAKCIPQNPISVYEWVQRWKFFLVILSAQHNQAPETAKHVILPAKLLMSVTMSTPTYNTAAPTKNAFSSSKKLNINNTSYYGSGFEREKRKNLLTLRKARFVLHLHAMVFEKIIARSKG